MNIADLRQRYPGYSDDEIVGALQATKYQDFTVQEIKDVLGVKPPKRSLFALANDTVIEAANAAAGTVGAIGDFISPGNSVSQFIDDKIIRAGEEKQSDAVKADKARFRDRLESADGVLDELGAVGGYITDAPLQALAQAAGSFAVPAGGIKAVGGLAKAAGAGTAGVTRAGLAGGVGIGAAGAGGDAAGTAYDLSKKAGATDEQATSAARGASVIPAIIGGAGGLIGAERLVAGAGGFKGGLLSRALKTGAAEGLQEGVEEGVTQYEGQRAAMPYDPTIDPSKSVAGAAGMGIALGFATGGGAALLHQQQKADVGMQDLRAATNADDAIDAALRATDVPLEVPPAFDRFGEALPPNAGPRAVNDRAIDEIRQLDPEQQQEALGLLATIGSKRASPAVRRFAQNALDAMLLPVRQIPTGEATDLAPTIPTGEVQELTASEAGPQIVEPASFEQRRGERKRVPVGEATEIQPESIELETIPTPDVIEVGGDAPRPDGMPERRRTPEPAPPAAPMTEDMLVKAVVDGFRGTNTPQARAFVQDFEAGRIKPADVLKLVGRPPQSPDERLAAAAAQAPQKTELQPGDLLTSDGMPYGTRSGAYARQKKEGGSLIEVHGGWAIRPRDAEPDQVPSKQQPVVAPQVSATDPAAQQVPSKQPDAQATTSVAQDLEALRNRDRGFRTTDDVRKALESAGLTANDKFKDTSWGATIADGRADLDVLIDPATGDARVTGSYMGRDVFQRTAKGGPAIAAALDEARAGLEEGERRRKAMKEPKAPQLPDPDVQDRQGLRESDRQLDTTPTLKQRADKMRKGQPTEQAKAPATKQPSTAAVGQSFTRMVQEARDDLEGVLYNWQEAELSPDGDRIVLRTGRDGRFSKGKEGGKIGGSKGEFLAWLTSNAPFDPAVYGKDIGKDAEWRRQVEALRTLAQTTASANRDDNTTAADRAWSVRHEQMAEAERQTAEASSLPAVPAVKDSLTVAEAPKPERPDALIELRKRLSVLEALRRCIG